MLSFSQQVEYKYTTQHTEFRQEKMRGQRRRLPVQPLGYVMSRKVIFRRAEVSVLLEVCFPRRPHEGQPRLLHVMSVKGDLTFVDQNDFQKRGK